MALKGDVPKPKPCLAFVVAAGVVAPKIELDVVAAAVVPPKLNEFVGVAGFVAPKPPKLGLACEPKIFVPFYVFLIINVNLRKILIKF